MIENTDGYNRIISKVPFVLNSKQLRHATLILERVPELSKLRNFLCPKAMDDDTFWRIYFCLIKNQVKDILDSKEMNNTGWRQLALNNPKQKKSGYFINLFLFIFLFFYIFLFIILFYFLFYFFFLIFFLFLFFIFPNFFFF